jgi:hypothetical protein
MTEFERALAALPVASRGRAAEVRKAFQLHEDDAVWAIYGTLQAALAELPQVCAEAARRGARDLRGRPAAAHGALPYPTPARARSERELRTVTWASLYVAGTVLLGSTCFALSAIASTGRAGWLGANANQRGPFAYSLSAILSAPIGGTLVLTSLVLLGAATAATRIYGARVTAILRASDGTHRK